MGTQSEEEPEFFADPPAQLEEDIALGFKNFKIADYVGGSMVIVCPKFSWLCVVT